MISTSTPNNTILPNNSIITPLNTSSNSIKIVDDISLNKVVKTTEKKLMTLKKVKKKRKQYVITKPRELWTTAEHDAFVAAIAIHERDWKEIAKLIPSKTIIQIRSHAQKYFIKMRKLGHLDKIPPARQKKKKNQILIPLKNLKHLKN